ncbi:PE/PPE C-terminal domain-containing protein [Mycobacterium innocens]|uniref:PE/PPE C-terminal domain-containing protein n=1 Tax=Mycobacterium innocens TaxID=2341083 RepID=UPI0009E1CF4F|nr:MULTISPECIES: PE/PPE C-terminal domain-containing protein [Mycobacterium]
MGRAGLVVALSVPQTWTTAVPARAPAALASTGLSAAPADGADGRGGMRADCMAGRAGRDAPGSPGPVLCACRRT